jgi:uncharacterized Fe-S cluster-containing radical SAM superfamily protein
MTTKAIDTDRISPQLRARGIDLEARELLITRFDGSEQEQDFSEPSNCAGLGRIRHFHRQTPEGWPENTLPIDPAARALALDPAPDTIRAQVFQNAVCNWRCWYCYVDFPLLSGNRDHAEMRSVDELVELYRQETSPPAVIDLSGGQPDLVPEWVPWMIEALSAHGLGDEVYLWSDDNLSNDYFFTKLSPEQRTIVDSCTNYGKVCCFKGFDSRSFAFNTAAAPELFERQFELMGRLLRETEIDLFAYATFTTSEDQRLSEAMESFVDRLQVLDPNLPLRLVPLQVAAFTPTQPRMHPEHHRALAIQEEAIAAWNAELSRRFTVAELDWPICDVSLQRD